MPAAPRRRRGWIAVVAAVVVVALVATGAVVVTRLLGRDDEVSVSMARPAEQPATRAAGEATAAAVQHYVDARLATESLYVAIEAGTPITDLAVAADALVVLWQEVEASAAVARDVSGRAAVVLGGAAEPVADDTAAGAAPVAGATVGGGRRLAVAATGPSAVTQDGQTWAENLTRRFDELKGAKRYQQLADQMGTDARTAYETVALAQRILQDAAALEEAEGDVAALTDSLAVLKTYTTASKVGLFVTATVATGGGTLGTLSTAGFTATEATGIVLGGVDCIVDVADTGSTILLGENNQVAATAEAVSTYLGPVSSVFGLATFPSAGSAERLAYVGDALRDWFSGGKVLGVQVTATPDGGTMLTARALEALGEVSLRTALTGLGLVFPETMRPLVEVVNGPRMDRDAIVARLDAIVAQMAAIEAAAADGVTAGPATPAPEDPQVPAAGPVGGWPADFYGVALPAPVTGGTITEMFDEVNGFGDQVTTIRIDGMTPDEFAAYHRTLTALPGWAPTGENNMPWDVYDDDRDYEFRGTYSSLARVAVTYWDVATAESLGVPQFQMLVFLTY
jgi:hypothetical protein